MYTIDNIDMTKFTGFIVGQCFDGWLANVFSIIKS